MFELLPNGKKIYTNEVHRVSLDGMLLSDFAAVKSGQKAVDIGCGCGIIGLRLAARENIALLMIDISESACLLARHSVSEGEFSNAKVLCADVREWRTAERFDAAFCNPPYFTSGARPESAERSAARHADSLNLADACAAAAHALKQGGHFYVCCPPDNLADAFCSLRAHHLEPKALAFAVNKKGVRWLCLIRAVYFGGTGLSILNDINSEEI